MSFINPNPAGGTSGGAVASVNGQTGVVVLTAANVGAVTKGAPFVNGGVGYVAGGALITSPKFTWDNAGGVFDVDGMVRTAQSVESVGGYRWSAVVGTPDVFLLRGAANVLEQRNGANAQGHYVYNTYTNAADYERINLEWVANQAQITVANAGSGQARGLSISSNGLFLNGNGNTTTILGGAIAIRTLAANLWQFDPSGRLYPEAGNAQSDLGAGGNPVRSIFTSGTAASAPLKFLSTTAPSAPANGDVWFDGTNLRIQVAGTTFTIVKV